MTEGSGETRLSDQIAYYRSLCDAATLGGWYADNDNVWGGEDGAYMVTSLCSDSDAAFIAAHDPSVVSALLDVAEAAAQVMDYDGATSAEDSVYGILARSLDVLSQRMEERP